MAWHSALAISVLGLSVLGFGKLAPSAAGGPVAVLVAPWETGGMAFAATVDLPIIDIAWGGIWSPSIPQQTRRHLTVWDYWRLPHPEWLGAVPSSEKGEKV